MSELSVISNPECLFQRKIVMYGASGGGKAFLQRFSRLGLNLVCFCDSDPQKWNTEFCGYHVISPGRITEHTGGGYLIVITSVYGEKIKENLEKIGISSKDIVTAFSVRLAVLYLVCHKPELLPQTYCEEIRLQKELFSNKGDFSWEEGSINNKRMFEVLDDIRPPVFVFNPGKVGSTSVFKSIDGERYQKHHFHDMVLFYKNNGITKKIWNRYLELLEKTNRKIKIITGVREPIAREISVFFQQVSANPAAKVNTEIPFMENIINPNVYTTTMLYLAEHFKCGQEFDWYEWELEKFFHISLRETPFNRERGFSIYRNKNVDVFVYKMEHLNELEQELAEFLHVPSFKLRNDNMANEKEYSLLYRECLQKIELPKEYVDLYYKNNDWMDYFYTQEEQKGFLERWEERII